MTEQKLAFERGLIRQMEADLAAKDEVRDLPLSSSLKIFQDFFCLQLLHLGTHASCPPLMFDLLLLL